MADIKTKKTHSSTIKTIDKAGIMNEKLKRSYAKTRQMTDNSYYTEENSPSEYAIDKADYTGKNLMYRSRTKADAAGRRSMSETRSNITTLKENTREKRIVSGIRDKNSSSHSPSYVSAAKDDRIFDIKTFNRSTIKSGEEVLHHAKYKKIQQIQRKELAKKIMQKNVSKSRKNVIRIKDNASRVTYAIRRAVASIRALITALIAMGWIAVVIVIICCLFGAAFYFFGDEGTGNYMPVSAEVEAYTPVIKKYAKMYDADEYIELIKAVMMQESGGRGNDPMQASECGFNNKYPRKPNGITDPEYSIKCGIQNLMSVLKDAKVQNPVDMDRIKLALQGYNFGNGYILWATKKYGGYTEANALEFSKLQAKKHGWDSYGDPKYVSHVLRYYPYGDYSYDIEYNGKGKLGLPIKNMKRSNISSHYGPRPSPGGIGTRYHEGLDIAFPTGTKILACEKGTVISAGWNGGLGKCVIIDHGNGLETVYGHMSRVEVKSGQKVLRGQVIGRVGSTGNSTGPHLHLGIRENGKYVNPEKGWLTIP